MRRILIVGASSMIGSHLAVALRKKHRIFGTYQSHRPYLNEVTLLCLALNSAPKIREMVKLLKPTVILYCAGITDERRCTNNPGQAAIINAEGAAILAEELATYGGRLVYFSTSKVFSGDRGDYLESDSADGGSLYGRDKRHGEERLMQICNALVLRLGNVFGLSQFPARTFLNRLLNNLHNDKAVPLITDEFRTFYGVDEVCRAVSLLLDLPEIPTGIFHISNGRKDSFHSFALKLAGIFGLELRLIRPILGAAFSQINHVTSNRGADLSLVGEAFAKQFHFQLAPPEESLLKLKISLQKGRW